MRKKSEGEERVEKGSRRMEERELDYGMLEKKVVSS